MPTKETVNVATEMTGNIFMETRQKSFHLKKKSFHFDNFNENKPWFGPLCKTACKKYHLARKKFNISKSTEDKNNLIYHTKQYKKTMDKFITKYREENETKLRKMQFS